MHFLKDLSFGFIKRVPTILQSEASECGLACIAMITSYHNYKIDLFSLRQKFPISQKGTTLHNLIKLAEKVNLSSRPLKLDLHEIQHLQLPCILHWNLNHFVVLTEVHSKHLTIIDPAQGQIKIPIKKVSDHFTGIALELWPNNSFEEKEENQELKLSKIIGQMKGIWKSFHYILLLALVLEVLSLLSPFLMQWIVDHVVVAADLHLLTTLTIGFGLLLLISQLIRLLQSWLIMYMATTLSIQWKFNIFKHLTHLPSEYFAKRHLGDVVSRFGSVDAIQTTLTTTFISAILDGLMTTLTLTMMFIFSPKLTFIAIFIMLLYIIVRWISYNPLRRASEEQIVHGAKQSSNFMETIRGIKTIQLFQRQNSRQNTWVSLFVNQINSSLLSQKISIIVGFLNGFIFGIGNLIIIYIGIMSVIEGVFTLGFFLAFLAYKNQFNGRISSLIDKFVQLKMLSIHTTRLADIVLTEPAKDHERLVDKENLLATRDIKFDIEINNLSFQYADDEPSILENISFKIKEGQSVAIIGQTGCGKTTLMNIILGLYRPSSGEVKINGQNIHDGNNSYLRNFITTVNQDDTLFAGSVLENISFFDNNLNEMWAIECAKMACVHDDIIKMPMGYQTLVGDMGSILSGGQKQRLLLARALYYKPKILFLDEATSNLDIEKEKEINEIIKSLNITRFIIAHRSETIRSTDRIIEIKNGLIVNDYLN